MSRKRLSRVGATGVVCRGRPEVETAAHHFSAYTNCDRENLRFRAKTYVRHRVSNFREIAMEDDKIGDMTQLLGVKVTR